jgi:hypothetical protein
VGNAERQGPDQTYFTHAWGPLATHSTLAVPVPATHRCMCSCEGASLLAPLFCGLQCGRPRELDDSANDSDGDDDVLRGGGFGMGGGFGSGSGKLGWDNSAWRMETDESSDAYHRYSGDDKEEVGVFPVLCLPPMTTAPSNSRQRAQAPCSWLFLECLSCGYLWQGRVVPADVSGFRAH